MAGETSQDRRKRRAILLVLLLLGLLGGALAWSSHGEIGDWLGGIGAAAPLESTAQTGGVSSALPEGSGRTGTAGGSEALAGDGSGTPPPPTGGSSDPFNLTATPGPGPGLVDLNWTLPGGVDGENLTLTRTSTNGTTVVIPVNGTGLVDNVTPGVAYTYVLWASRPPGPSSPADEGTETSPATSGPVTVVSSPGAPAIPTPEMSSAWFVLAGGLGLALAWRARRG